MTFKTVCRLVLGAALLRGIALSPVGAQSPPVISRIEPLGIAPGAETQVTLHGSGLTGASALWTSVTDAPASSSPEPADSGDNAQFKLQVPQETPPGIAGLRVAGPGGVSRLRMFLIDSLPTHRAEKSNEAPLSLPCAVEGAVPATGTQVVRFTAGQGQALSFEVFARRLGSPLDPLIQIIDVNSGRELASADDTPGLGGDCQVRHRFETAGEYAIHLRDIQYAGGGEHVYRLRMGDFPCVQTAFPMGIAREGAGSVEAAGIAAEGNAVTLSQPRADAAGLQVAVEGQQASSFVSLILSDGPEMIEQEPNDAREQATAVSIGAAINGRFSSAEDVDWHRIPVKAGDRVLFRGVTRSEGSPTDLQLRLFDSAGKQLATADDQGSTDGLIDQKFTADGECFLEARHLHRRGGSQFVYRVETSRYQPGFRLHVDSDALNVPAGGVGTVTVTAERFDYAGPIDLAVEGLPEGWSTQPVRIGPGLNSGVLTVSAPKDGSTSGVLPIRVIGTARIGDVDVRAAADAADALQSYWNNPPVVPRHLRESIAAGLAAAQPLTLTIDPAEAVFGQELTAKVKVTAQRGEGLNEAIELATLPDKNALPGGVTLELKPIPKGESSIELNLTATDKAPLGAFSVVLVGVHKQEKQSVTAVAPALNYRLSEPFTATAAFDGPLVKGKSMKVRVTLARNPAFAAPVKVQLKEPPAGITAGDLEIPGEESAAELTIEASADAAAGVIPQLRLSLVSTANAKHVAEATLPMVEVKAAE